VNPNPSPNPPPGEEALGENDAVSLARLLRAGVLEAPALVEAIWKQATQEELLLLQLDQMEGRCDSLELAFVTYQEGGCYPFANVERLAAVCVGEQAALDVMKASPYLPGVVGRYEQVRERSTPVSLSLVPPLDERSKG